MKSFWFVVGFLMDSESTKKERKPFKSKKPNQNREKTQSKDSKQKYKKNLNKNESREQKTEKKVTSTWADSSESSSDEIYFKKPMQNQISSKDIKKIAKNINDTTQETVEIDQPPQHDQNIQYQQPQIQESNQYPNQQYMQPQMIPDVAYIPQYSTHNENTNDLPQWPSWNPDSLVFGWNLQTDQYAGKLVVKSKSKNRNIFD